MESYHSNHKITIGDGLLTVRFVYIGDNSHGGLSWEEAEIPPEKRKLKSKGEIMIGKNVWIGDKYTILGGVTIGDNVIIGANSVVPHDIPSNSVWGGERNQETHRDSIVVTIQCSWQLEIEIKENVWKAA